MKRSAMNVLRRTNIIRSSVPVAVDSVGTTAPLLEQRRGNYQIALRRQLDRKTGKMKYQDWDYLVNSIQDPRLLNGTTLLNRHLRATEHIKPTERKRRINSKKIYYRNNKRVDDLTNYIKFMQEHDTHDDNK